MLPLKDHNPTSSRAIVMPILIAINVVVFFFVQPFSIGSKTPAQQDQQQIDEIVFFSCHAAIPTEVSHGKTLVANPPQNPDRDAQNALIAERARCPHKNVCVSIFYSMFLHGSLLHIGG